MFINYNNAVGWIGHPPVLYDKGQAEVRATIVNGTALPAQHIITPDRRSDVTVSEQPMSRYAISGGPGEDFAETVAAYVTNPSVLYQRSPLRFLFLQNNLSSWISSMRQMIPAPIDHPLGDYPEMILPEGQGYA